MIAAAVVFIVSLLAILALFLVKNREERTGRQFAPQVRRHMDHRADELKVLMTRGRAELAKLPPEIVYLSRLAVHDLALGAAALARTLEQQAHRLADLVSHKHHFERRETTNEFLKQVSEHPIRDSRSNGAGKNGNGLDTNA